MSYTSGPISWRLPIACQVIFAFVVIVVVFGLPESPRHLYNTGCGEEGLQVLCDVRILVNLNWCQLGLMLPLGVR